MMKRPVSTALPNEGKRLAPIALPAEKPVAQFVIHRFLADALFLEPFRNATLGFGSGKAVQRDVRIGRVDGDSFIGKPPPIGLWLRWLNHLDDAQLELEREFKIPLVMPWHGHDRARAIGSQDIVRDPDRNLRAI